MSAPWTEAHQREALRYLGKALSEDGDTADLPLAIMRHDVCDEEGFRRAVVRLVDLDGEERAVARVRGLAEGRLVRETSERWDAQRSDGDADTFAGREEARAFLAPDDGLDEHGNPAAKKHLARVRVTRVRRAR